MTTPVVFIHMGNQDYLKRAIDQAKKRNERVVLIGDESNADFAPEHARWDDLWHEHFANVYQHMSFNHEEFTLRGMERWYALLGWMEHNGQDAAFHFDTDVMVYCDVASISYGESLAALQILRKSLPAGVSASGHASYWTRDALRQFCDSMYRTYTSERGLAALQVKWAWHMLTRTPGGICDMTLLYIWSLGKDVVNNAGVIDGATFEHNVNGPDNLIQDEYRMKGGIKEITMIDGLPHGWHEHRHEHIRFNAIHFQGQAKALMEEYAG